MVSSGQKRSADEESESHQAIAETLTSFPKKRCDAQAASQRHIKTEQARRDKISAGFQALQDLLPGREKVEKAMLLGQAADYICQLQAVLQMLMSSGSMSKLPDNLQWQIRTLLPRKDGKSQPMAVTEPVPVETAPQQGFTAPHCPSPINLAAASLQLPLPTQASMNMGIGDTKELPKDEAALYAQVQALLHQQQQQAVAAQQIQNWQQTLQTLQLQQVLSQQQGQVMPDLMNGLCGYGVMPPPMGSMPLQVTQPSNAPLPMAGSNDPELAALPVPKALPEKDPSKCFADELPRCGLQQLVDAACENSQPLCRGPHSSPHKARKSNVKVRRHTTAARIPKPQGPNPARVGPGRPEPV